MATGYTYKIKEGKTNSIREFALDCARQFGACISLRDEPSDTPIPDEFVPGNYNKDSIEKAQRELTKAQNMTLAEAKKKAEEEYKTRLIENKEKRKRIEQERKRYESMLEKVKTWEPPTPNHEKLKRFMVSQLEESIKYDCSSKLYMEQPKKQTGEEYKANLIRYANEDIKLNTREYNREVKITKERTDWIRALRNSLPEE